jgi:hypothetical protein
MSESWSFASAEETSSPGLTDKSSTSVDQELGYSGHDRFVLFYYEWRGHEVRWRDSQSCGPARGGWPPLFADIQAYASAYGLSLGFGDQPGDHVVLVDRVAREARFAYREEAQDFLARQQATAA